MNPALAFDRLARGYDRQWSQTPAGRAQRKGVWRELEKLFHAGDRVIDLGCGTGEDSVWLARRGVEVTAIDPSPEMVRQAQAKGVDASVGDLKSLTGTFDGLLS